MKRFTIALTAALAAVAVTACVPVDADPSTGSAATTTWSYTPPAFTAPKTTVPVKAADPYRTTGTWLVPAEIAPGTYRVALQPGKSGGYSKVCADFSCEIGTSGFIANELYSGPGVLVIPDSAVSVEIKRITLTPMVGA